MKFAAEVIRDAIGLALLVSVLWALLAVVAVWVGAA